MFELAQRWSSELSSFTLVGLEAAVEAALKWGQPDDVAELRVATDSERARIEEMLS